jgi:GT2 family glycosyltransferase
MDTSILNAGPAPATNGVHLEPAVELPVSAMARPRAAGKFLFVGDRKLWLKGVQYGNFPYDDSGRERFDLDVVERDFAQMAAAGINTVRLHVTPPRAVLDAAERHGLYVMVGLVAEKYVGYLTDGRDVGEIEAEIRREVAPLAGHPAILCFALGNEIPAPVVRYLGARKIERYLERLYRMVKAEDPAALVTYVNYPTTEYLELPFLDFLAFNVYLETREKLGAYLQRLQNIAGDRPLVLAEIGLDSIRNGEARQAEMLDWQVRLSFATGCAGCVVFTWTDDWYRSGVKVEDWAFGITDRERNPKPALAAVNKAFAEVPFPSGRPWPRISIVVCSYNGARTIRDTLEGIAKLAYPNFETIVVNDGSKDATPEIAARYDVRLISTENRGLSSARNTGYHAATGEIVAYIDDDAYPDPHWLHYLADTFMASGHMGVGGPNLPPPGDGRLAECVACSPGGPVHVLLTDTLAEHIPGCNMAFRKSALEAVGGFDARYRVAGDDVDLCWRLQERGWTIGFNPAALVWHHRRNSAKTYLRQQRGYGKAEALLAEKWPEKYNGLGHATWHGRIYGNGLTLPIAHPMRVYHGMWGSAPFQTGQRYVPGVWAYWPMMPEWYGGVAALTALAMLGIFWAPLLWALVPLAVAVGVPVVQAAQSAAAALPVGRGPSERRDRLEMLALITALHVAQPAARLYGRLRHGLTPWRQRAACGLVWPRRGEDTVWSGRWQAPEVWLSAIDRALRGFGFRVRQGGDFDRWDIEVSGGALAHARLLLAAEDHKAGTQYLRFHLIPGGARSAFALAGVLAAIAVAAAASSASIPAVACLLGAAAIGGRAFYERAAAMGALKAAINTLRVDLMAGARR